MSQVLIREVEPSVIERLRNRARRNGRSLEAELRTILRRAAGLEMKEALDELKRIQAGFEGRVFSDSAELIRQDRDR
jgi:plasmid stability protein